MDMPEKCVEMKREIMQVLKDALDHIPDRPPQNEIRGRIKKLITGTCPEFPVVVEEEVLEDEVVHETSN